MATRFLLSAAIGVALGALCGVLFDSVVTWDGSVAVFEVRTGPTPPPGLDVGERDGITEPFLFEQPIPISDDPSFCAPVISIAPDGTAVACGEPAWLPPAFEAPAI